MKKFQKNNQGDQTFTPRAGLVASTLNRASNPPLAEIAGGQQFAGNEGFNGANVGEGFVNNCP